MKHEDIKQILPWYQNCSSQNSSIGEYVSVEVLSEPDSRDNVIMIAYWNGQVVSFPLALIKANDLVIKDGKLTISKSMYNTWFRDKVNARINELSQKLCANFDKVVEGANKIIHDREFYYIKLPVLKSTILYCGEFDYSLGSLLNAWIKNDQLSISGDRYMLKIIVSPLSGTNKYLAYSRKEKALVTGSLDSGDKNWNDYVKILQTLVTPKTNSSNLLALTRLVQELNIE